MRTIPLEASTVSSMPSLITEVPTVVPTTQGRRYSRETTAEWLRTPPVSETTALTVEKGRHPLSRALGLTRTILFYAPSVRLGGYAKSGRDMVAGRQSAQVGGLCADPIDVVTVGVTKPENLHTPVTINSVSIGRAEAGLHFGGRRARHAKSLVATAPSPSRAASPARWRWPVTRPVGS